MYSELPRKQGQSSTRLIVLAGGVNQRFQWLEANAEQLSQAKPLALLLSGEVLGFSDSTLVNKALAFDAQLRMTGISVTRMAAGCVCCSSKLLLNTHLGRMMRLLQPAILVLELDSQTHQANVEEMLSDGQWKGWFSTLEAVNLSDKT